MEDVWEDNLDRGLEAAVTQTYNYGLREGYSRDEIIDVISQLAGRERRRALQYIPEKYTPQDPRKSCTTDDYGEVIDPITQQEIPPERLLSFVEGNTRFCFDIESLAEYVRRSKPENPATRVPLSPEVLRRLQEYEEESRLLTCWVKFPNSPPGLFQNFTVRFPKGDAFVELVVEVARKLGEIMNLPSVEVLQKYLILLEGADVVDFEEPIEEERVVLVQSLKDRDLAYLLEYYDDLTRACANRYSLISFANAAREQFNNLLLDASFMKSAAVMSEYNGVGGTILYHVKISGNIFKYLDTVRSYYKPLRSIVGGVSITYGDGAQEFVKDWRPPQDFDEIQEGASEPRRKDLHSRVFNTFLTCLDVFISRTDAKSVRECLLQMKKFLPTRDIPQNTISDIVQTFEPKETYRILQFFAPIKPLDDVPEDLVTSGYYARLLGYTGKEEKVITDLLLASLTPATVVVQSQITDPVLQAKVVALLDDPKVYAQYKKTLDKNVLFAELVRNRSRKVLGILSVPDKILLSLREGYNPEKVRTEELIPVLDSLLKSDTDRFNSEAFAQYIDVLGKKVTLDYLLRSAKSEVIFVGVLTAIFRKVTQARDTWDENPLFTEQDFTELVCNVTRDRDIAEHVKVAAFRHLFAHTHYLGSDKFVQSLYDCLGVSNAVQAYLARTEGVPIAGPRITESQLLDLDVETIRQLVKRGQIPENYLYRLYEKLSRQPRVQKLIEVFSQPYLGKLSPQEILNYVKATYFVNRKIVVPHGQFYALIRESKVLQRNLVDLMRELDLLPRDVNILSKIGLDYMLEDYKKQILEGVTDEELL